MKSSPSISEHKNNRLNFPLRKADLHSHISTPSQWAYLQLLEERDKGCPRSFSSVECSCINGLVSIILPVYNGMKYLAESIKSVLAQTYANWELIIVDDGSTDDTPLIAQEYAKKDSRISYVHQSNQKLPSALNTGHELSKGEYITWTSDDNRLKPDFLLVLVNELRVRPEVDMLYANLEVIDSSGNLIGDHAYYRDYQHPPLSGSVILPGHVSMLHIWNCIGAAFLYRRRVTTILGAYSDLWFTCEDYDFFLRVNEQMVLRHATTSSPLYQYRVHQNSLTAQSKNNDIQSKMQALKVFDDGRWDILSGPVLWHIDSHEGDSSVTIGDDLVAILNKQGHYCTREYKKDCFWAIPKVHVTLTGTLCAAPYPDPLVYDAYVMLYTGDPAFLKTDHDTWTLRIALQERPPSVKTGQDEKQWLFCSDVTTLFQVITAHATSLHARSLENRIRANDPNEIAISVVVCTNRPPTFAEATLRSLHQQTLSSEKYEVLLINNALYRFEYRPMIESICGEKSCMIREIIAWPGGLSYARNAGLSAARGKIIVYLDDDALALPDLLERYVRIHDAYPDAGCVGGSIHLLRPEPLPRWWGDHLARFWSDLKPKRNEPYLTNNWIEFPYGANMSFKKSTLLKIGGFRSRYGPGGRIMNWGDDTTACLNIRKLGGGIVIEPRASVRHNIDPRRFSPRELFIMCKQSYATMARMILEKRLPPVMRFHSAFLRGVARFLLALAPIKRPISYRLEQMALSWGLIHASLLMLQLNLHYIFKRPS